MADMKNFLVGCVVGVPLFLVFLVVVFANINNHEKRVQQEATAALRSGGTQVPIAAAAVDDGRGYKMGEAERRVLRAFMVQDANMWVAGVGDSVLGAPEGMKEGVPLRVSAKTIIKAFDDNEVAANAQYKDKRVLIIGKIQDIGTNVGGDPYVALAGDDLLHRVVAYFPIDRAVEVIPLKKGEKASLVCRVSGLHLAMTVANDCIVADRAYAESVAMAQVVDVIEMLRLRKPPNRLTPVLAAMAVAYARRVPAGSICLDDLDRKECSPEKVFGSMQATERAMKSAAQVIQDSGVEWMKVLTERDAGT